MKKHPEDYLKKREVKKAVVIRLDPKLKMRAAALAKSKRVSLNMLMSAALERYIEELK